MKSITCLFGYRCIEAIEFDMNGRDLALLGRPKGIISEQNFDTFDIDGSGGERIDMVDIYYQMAPVSRPRTVAEILSQARDRPLDSSKFRALGVSKRISNFSHLTFWQEVMRLTAPGSPLKSCRYIRIMEDVTYSGPKNSTISSPQCSLCIVSSLRVMQ
jgi:hypothetical protein